MKKIKAIFDIIFNRQEIFERYVIIQTNRGIFGRLDDCDCEDATFYRVKISGPGEVGVELAAKVVQDYRPPLPINHDNHS